MSGRKDVESGRLVYTCNCGWVDKGHANPSSTRQNVGAESLWKQIKDETGVVSRQGGGFKVTYTQDMRKWGLSAGVTKTYYVKKGLSTEQKESVALAIFMEVSHGFESLQASFPYSVTTDSGYSEEDLVSNLIGFYLVVRPGVRYLDLCQEVSKKASLKVWDKFGAVGSNKNTNFSPVFHECDECKGARMQFPSSLEVIRPAQRGALYRDWRLVTVGAWQLAKIGYPPEAEASDELILP